MSYIFTSVRASTSTDAKFFAFCVSKTYFFYFTHSFLQNNNINLSILHIYSIKYSFFYFFLLFSHSWALSLSLTALLSLRPNHRHHHSAAIKPKPKSVYLLCAFFVSHSHGWSEPKPRSSWNPRLIKAKVDQTHSSVVAAKVDRSPLRLSPKATPTKRTPCSPFTRWLRAYRCRKKQRRKNAWRKKSLQISGWSKEWMRSERKKEKRSRDERKKNEKNGDQQERRERKN